MLQVVFVGVLPSVADFDDESRPNTADHTTRDNSGEEEEEEEEEEEDYDVYDEDSRPNSPDTEAGEKSTDEKEEEDDGEFDTEGGDDDDEEEGEEEELTVGAFVLVFAEDDVDCEDEDNAKQAEITELVDDDNVKVVYDETGQTEVVSVDRLVLGEEGDETEFDDDDY